MVIGSADASVGDLVSVVGQPCGPSLFKSGPEHMAVAAFDHARADGQTQDQRAWIVQTVQTIAQIAIPAAHRSFRFRCSLGFQMFRQGCDH